ncbi:hypothetical protein [Pseudomonas sp. LRF_L74]
MLSHQSSYDYVGCPSCRALPGARCRFARDASM